MVEFYETLLSTGLCVHYFPVLSATFVFAFVFLLVWYFGRHLVKYDGRVSVSTMCLGRPFKPGMLYASSEDRLLSAEQMLWSPIDIKKSTSTHWKDFKNVYEVIADDSLSSKVTRLGVQGNSMLSVVTGSATYSKSGGYLRDVRSSSRQARVVLRYECNTKYKELKMDFGKVSATADPTVTHVVVGVEYGVEAYIVFDKDVPDDEDYEETCRQMISLVQTLQPDFATNKKTLSEEEKMLASQLQYTIYSDIPVQDPKCFEDAAQICKILAGFAAIDVVISKKAWLYPLHVEKNDALTCRTINIDADKALKVFDQLHTSRLRTKSLRKHKACGFFDCYYKQLSQFKKLIDETKRTLKKDIKSELSQIQQGQCNEKLEDAINNANCDSISIEQWLNGKEEEMSQISEYLILLESAGVTLLISRDDEFESFVRCEGASNCFISLEFELYQKQDFIDPKKIPHYPFSIDVMRKIEVFTSFARECKEAKCVVTTSRTIPRLQQGVVTLLYDPDRPYPSEFNPPAPVEKPKFAESKSWDMIKIKWSTPSEQFDALTGYVVFFTSTEDGPWKTKFFEGNSMEAEIDDLQPSTVYMFKVAAKYKYGLGPYSVISDKIITDSLPLPVKIKRDPSLSEKHLHQGSIEIFRLKATSIMTDQQMMVAKLEFGRPQLSKHTKVVMLMGATGAGKSTQINAMVNYVLGVDYNDTFRFILIYDETKKSQAHSQTSFITTYILYWQDGFKIPYNLVIIDTPGFGDTRGLEQDEKTVAQIRNLFSLKGENTIVHINAIGFVAQASLVRLTLGQKYIFDSVLSIFGKDVKDNIVIMATFADAGKPKVMAALIEDNVPFSGVFTFNNCALYQDNENNPVLDLTYWNNNYHNLKKFFDHLLQVDAKTLVLTIKVLKERKQLEMILNGVQPKVQDFFSKIEILRIEEELLLNRCSELVKSENFKYTVTVAKQRRKDLQAGTYVTNCVNCSFTCHYPCSISDDTEKYSCSAMDENGQSGAKCKVCPGKCSWKDHYNNTYCFEIYEDKEERTSEYLRNHYNIEKNSTEETEQAITKLHDEVVDLSKTIYADIHEARCCTERLNEIALKPHPLTDLEYINLLIESEKMDGKPGSSRRIEVYLKLKNQAEIMKSFSSEKILEELRNQDNKKKWWKFWTWFGSSNK